MHRDLKPENFLLSSNTKNAEVKLADFGLSAKYSESSLYNTTVGTPYYVAPEVIHGSYGLACDIWSAGVNIFFLLSGEQPFYGQTV